MVAASQTGHAGEPGRTSAGSAAAVSAVGGSIAAGSIATLSIEPATTAATASLLVFERDAVTWALPRVAVLGLTASATRTTWIALAGSGNQPTGTGGADAAAPGRRILAERVHGWAELVVRPAGAIVAERWAAPCAGLAVWAGRPVVVVDPARLPPPWRRVETSAVEDEQRAGQVSLGGGG